MNKLVKKLIKKHIVPIIAIFIFANYSIAYLIFSKAQNSNCLYQSDIDKDPRCLYVYRNEVYQMGTRNKPHKGKDCGINVDNIIPDLHFSGNTFTKFKQAKIGTFCPGSPVQPTQSPTQEPTLQPTQNPTQRPATITPTVLPTIKPTNISTSTTQPTVEPTKTNEPVIVVTPEPENANIEANKEDEITYTGRTFGEILGKPKSEDPKDITDSIILTKISKPIVYISLGGFITSLILILFF